ncbi:MAG: right-handed parallel beta-helix repeat-containing protein [Phycisphaerae bacterium]
MRSFILIAAALSATQHTLAKTVELHPNDSISEAIAHLERISPAAHNTLLLHAGTYHLDHPLRLTEADNHLTLKAALNEPVILSGSRPLTLTWTHYKNNILQATIPAGIKSIDQLLINNHPQHLARYPNFDPAIPIFNSYSPDALSPERIKIWSDPTGGYIHALHNGRWGSMDFLITGKNPDGSLATDGGWQINRPSPMHKQFRFVENIFEELDAPNEFFFNPKSHTLYFYPPNGLDPSHATVEINNLETLIDMHGSGGRDYDKNPAANITLRGLTFTHTNRTFMQTKEPILRSDWCIARTAALFLENTANIKIENCTFENLGGNAIFLSNFNQHDSIEACHIHDIGASAIVFLGDPHSVRDPLFNYKATPNLTNPDLTPGPLTQNFPQDCQVSNCLIHSIGQIEKQSAGVDIDIAARITVSHCSIYDTPRAGINIGDGCFGGHRIEFNDVFDTVLETSDHGAFNSWGRDRFWTPDRKQINQRVAQNPALPLLDIPQPNTLANNRFRCDHGWDIDLDDGSSNYLIQNNLCLAGGLKLREGYDRHADNNILLNNTLFAHVWLDHSHDTCTHNILMRSYRPTGMPKNGADWGSTIDNNFFTQPTALQKAHDLGLDPHSAAGAPQFLDPTAGNFNVAENSPALAVGFKNFPMDQFGVTEPALRKLARTSTIPSLTNNDDIPNPRETPTFWLGARIKPVTTDAEVSAAGLPDKKGILILDLPANSPAAKLGLQKLDVILEADHSPATSPGHLPASPQSLVISRNQSEVTLEPK